MSFRLLEIIKDPDKRAILSWLGGGAVVAAGGIWTAVTFVVEHKDASDKKGGTNITVSGQGIVSGRDTNIIGPSKEQIEQIQEPLTGQLPSGDRTSPRSTGLSWCSRNGNACRERRRGTPSPRPWRRLLRNDQGRRLARRYSLGAQGISHRESNKVF
jgi:hypothetical protein